MEIEQQEQAPVEQQQEQAPVEQQQEQAPEPKIEDSPFYSSFPDDWRTQAVAAAGFEGDDATKAGNMLDRVSDFPALVKSMIESKRKISAGEISTGLPSDPTPEQLQAFREANGIPGTSNDYNIEIADGLDFSDADDAMLQGYLEAAHNGNVPEAVVTDMTNAFLQARQEGLDKRIAQDGLDQQHALNTLKDHWGPDFEVNKNIANTMVNQLPETVRDDFRAARMPDGSSVFNSPEVLAFFADMGRQLNPQQTLTNNGEAMSAGSIKAEMAEIEAKMGTSEYTKEVEKRYDQLLIAEEAMERNR